jgi:hypothetical protein
MELHPQAARPRRVAFAVAAASEGRTGQARDRLGAEGVACSLPPRAAPEARKERRRRGEEEKRRKETILGHAFRTKCCASLLESIKSIPSIRSM